jgi:hypothetical protein
MTSFKEWVNNKIFLEAGFSDSGSDWFFGNYLLPSDAYDWSYARQYPSDYFFLQSRWKKDIENGRKFINMNIEPTLQDKFVDIKSNTMPDEKPWIHRPDDRPNLSIDYDAKLMLMGIGKNSTDINKLVKCNDLLDKTDQLNKLFGKFTSSIEQEAVDKPWLNFKEWLG